MTAHAPGGLLGAPGAESSALSGRPRAALPAGLVRALDWLDAHPDEAFDLGRLALIAEVRPRTLEAQFRLYLDTSPLGWVRRARLARTRRELLVGKAGASVTRVALDNGFRELGRFAGHYRRQFGERPSETLAAGRRAGVGAATRDAQHEAAERVAWRAIKFAFTVGAGACGAALELAEEARTLAVSAQDPHARASAAPVALPTAIAAWCHGQRAAHGFGASPERDRGEALRWADRAVGEAPCDAMVLALASGAQTLARRLADADRLAERALALDPWLPWAWIRRGWLSAYTGDCDGALRELRITLELMPGEPLRHLAFIGIGCAHFGAGRFGAAARWIDDALALEPASFWAERVAVAAAVHAGERDEARRRARRLLRKDPSLSVRTARAAWPFPPSFVDRLGEGLERGGVPRE